MTLAGDPPRKGWTRTAPATRRLECHPTDAKESTVSNEDMDRIATGYTEFPPDFQEFMATRTRYLRARAEEAERTRAAREEQEARESRATLTTD